MMKCQCTKIKYHVKITTYIVLRERGHRRVQKVQKLAPEVFVTYSDIVFVLVYCGLQSPS